MKKIISFLLIATSLCVLLSSCSGYNKIMRDHLSDAANYQDYTVTLVDMYYKDTSNGETRRDFDNQDFVDYDVNISVTFETVEQVSAFLGGSPNKNKPLEDYKFSLVIHAANNRILFENGFYENIAIGNKINIIASDWIYMDGNFFYVAQVEYDGVVYLDFEDGLKNITDHMDENKSLL